MALEKMIDSTKGLNDAVKKNPEGWGVAETDTPGNTAMEKAKRTALNLATRRIAKTSRFHNPIKLEDEDHKFMLNGEERTAAGTYHPDTGEIKLYPKRIKNTADAEFILTHEIGHHKFRTVEKLEKKEIAKLSQNKAHTQEWNQMIDRDDPSFTPNLTKHYHVAAALHKAFHAPQQDPNKISDELAESDGVTDYSKDWWEAHKKGTASRMQAVDETHAELNALHYDASKLYDSTTAHMHIDPTAAMERKQRTVYGILQNIHGVHPRWIHLHKTVQDIYNDHMNKEQEDASKKSKDK